jgi:DNA replication protein DnaC
MKDYVLSDYKLIDCSDPQDKRCRCGELLKPVRIEEEVQVYGCLQRDCICRAFQLAAYHSNLSRSYSTHDGKRLHEPVSFWPVGALFIIAQNLHFKDSLLSDFGSEWEHVVYAYDLAVTGKSNGFILHSNVGLGKTKIMMAMIKDIVKRNHSSPDIYENVIYYNVFDLFEELKKGFDSEIEVNSSKIERIKSCKYLFLDDIGGNPDKRTKPISDWECAEFAGIIDARYANNKIIIASTNCSPSQLEERLGCRAADRLKCWGTINLKGKSLRNPLEKK